VPETGAEGWAKNVSPANIPTVCFGSDAKIFSAPLTLLTVSPLTLTFPFALITYIFVAHTLDAPNQALGAAILAGGVTALVGLFCVGLVKDTYVCSRTYSILLCN
jgi:hypothetical protein